MAALRPAFVICALIPTLAWAQEAAPPEPEGVLSGRIESRGTRAPLVLASVFDADGGVLAQTDGEGPPTG